MPFSAEQASTLANAPMMASLAVSMADLGIVSTALEASAMGKQIVEATKQYPNNSIIQEVFSDEAIKSGRVKLEKPAVSPDEVKSGALVERAIARINEALQVLENHPNPAEVDEYKQLILDAADAVANAAGSGLFGRGSPKVSPEEQAALNQLKVALGK